MHWLGSLLLASAAGLLTACMSSDFPRPDDWAPLPAPDVQQPCPTLDGYYSNVGEASDRYAADYSRVLSVGLLHVTPHTKQARVLLRQPSADQLDVVVLEADGQEFHRATLLASRGDLTCEAGVLWLRGITTVQKDGTGIGRNTKRLGLRLAADGSLSGQESSFGVGAIGWVVPIVGSQTIWFRWERTDSVTSSAAQHTAAPQ